MSSRREGHLNQRLTISVDDQFIEYLEMYMKARGHSGFSEAIRDIAREAFTDVEITAAEDDNCFAALSYAYNFKTRNLASRLSEIYATSDIVVSITKNHLIANNFIEVVILSGQRKTIEQFSRKILGERGVRNGQINIFPME